MPQNIDASALASILTRQFENLNIKGIVVGLSGGGDSWALTLLAHDYCRQNNLPFIALTVDHQLRPESADEAATCAAECARRDIKHEVLVWQHAHITSRKQEQARVARYNLMGDYCAMHGFTHLLTAHHADDQAETVLMRFAKGSGVAGLAAMAASRQLNDTVTLLRPLLNVRKQLLMDFATLADMPIARDSSNTSPAYARGRLRAMAEVLASEGLTTETLLKTATTARTERDALEYAAQELILKYLSLNFEMPAEQWLPAPPALQAIALIAIWRRVTGSTAYQPDRDSIRDLCAALTQGAVKRTLGGMIAERKTTRHHDILRFTPEKSAHTGSYNNH